MIGQLFATEDVEVQMLDALAAVLAAVGDDTVAVGESFRCGNFGNHLKNTRRVCAVFFVDAVGGHDMFLWNDQNMHGRHGGNIAEGVDPFVFVYLGRGNVSFDDLAE